MAISEIDRLRAQVARAEMQMQQMQRPRSGEEAQRMKDAQARCDSVLAHFGERASEPTPIEDELTYRRRLLATVCDRTAKFKGSRFDGFDAKGLEAVEPMVLAEAQDTARHDGNSRPGVLVPMQHKDPAGRTITTYAGDIGAFLAPFQAAGQVGFINRFPGKN